MKWNKREGAKAYAKSDRREGESEVEHPQKKNCFVRRWPSWRYSMCCGSLGELQHRNTANCRLFA